MNIHAALTGRWQMLVRTRDRFPRLKSYSGDYIVVSLPRPGSRALSEGSHENGARIPFS